MRASSRAPQRCFGTGCDRFEAGFALGFEALDRLTVAVALSKKKFRCAYAAGRPDPSPFPGPALFPNGPAIFSPAAVALFREDRVDAGRMGGRRLSVAVRQAKPRRVSLRIGTPLGAARVTSKNDKSIMLG